MGCQFLSPRSSPPFSPVAARRTEKGVWRPAAKYDRAGMDATAGACLGHPAYRDGLGWGWALYVGCAEPDARLLEAEGGGGDGYAEGCAAWR